jgi:OOP family OmpA-OmpF porin
MPVIRYVIPVLLLLTGCVSSLVQLQQAEPIGTPFQTYLAREYLDFAEAEADQYDWFNSSHFARKGLKAANGVDVMPEPLEEWDLEPDVQPILEQARTLLLKALTPDIKRNHAKDAARTQFMFDCWVEQQSEGWQNDHIAYCRENFYNTLDRLYNIIYPDQKKETPAAVSEATANSSAPKKEQTRTVYFDSGKSSISDKSKKVLSGIISELKKATKYEITLNGYADRVGKEDANLKLSKKRSDEVKKFLVQAGVNPNVITVFAFGNESSIVDNEKGAPEQENRVVEIVVEIE